MKILDFSHSEATSKWKKSTNGPHSLIFYFNIICKRLFVFNLMVCLFFSPREASAKKGLKNRSFIQGLRTPVYCLVC